MCREEQEENGVLLEDLSVCTARNEQRMLEEV